MPTNFPTALDTLTNPTSSNPQNAPSHSGQHADSNDAIEALEAKVGINGSGVSTSHDKKLADLASHGATFHADAERFLWFESREGLNTDAGTATTIGTAGSGNHILTRNLADTATQGIGTTVAAPADYVGGSDIGVELVYAPSGAGAANVRFQINWSVIELGDQGDETGTTVTWTQAVGATDDELAKTTRQNFTPVGLVAGDLFRLWLYRLGSDGADTYTGSIDAVGVFIYYTSGG